MVTILLNHQYEYASIMDIYKRKGWAWAFYLLLSGEKNREVDHLSTSRCGFAILHNDQPACVPSLMYGLTVSPNSALSSSRRSIMAFACSPPTGVGW